MIWAQATTKTVMEETNDNPQRSNDNRQVARRPSNQSGVYEQYGFNQSDVYNDYHDPFKVDQPNRLGSDISVWDFAFYEK